MRSEKEPILITGNILTSQNDRKDTWGSNKNKPDPPDIHEGHVENGISYAYRIPNRLELGNWNNREDHGICPPQPRPIPSKTILEPLPYLDPSEVSERSPLPLTSLLSPPKKDNIKPGTSSMYMERPDLSWNLCLVPAKKYSGVKPAEELEMREGIGLMREEASPCLEFGGGTGTGAARLDWMDSEAKPPLLAIPSAL